MRSLPGYSNLGCRFFPFSTLNIFCHSLLAFRVPTERSAVKHMEFSLYVTCCFSLAAFNILPLCLIFFSLTGFPGGSDSKASAYNAGDPASIPGLGRSPGEGNGNPLQYSCLENLMDRGAWWAAVHGINSKFSRDKALC